MSKRTRRHTRAFWYTHTHSGTRTHANTRAQGAIHGHCAVTGRCSACPLVLVFTTRHAPISTPCLFADQVCQDRHRQPGPREHSQGSRNLRRGERRSHTHTHTHVHTQRESAHTQQDPCSIATREYGQRVAFFRLIVLSTCMERGFSYTWPVSASCVVFALTLTAAYFHHLQGCSAYGVVYRGAARLSKGVCD